MKRYVEGGDRSQATLFPETLGEYIAEDNPVRVVDAFVDELDLHKLGFDGMEPETRATCVPSVNAAEDLHLRLSQSGAIEPTPGARSAAQR